MTRPQATSELLLEDESVRVTRFDFVPGAETGWHKHGMDYVITAVTDCPLLLEEPGGSRESMVPAGMAYKRAIGVEHNVINNGDKPMSFVEIELKKGI